jgi:2-oxoglutarate dehydrogenase E1 component
MELPEALNAHYIDAQYQHFKTDPESVSPQWRAFFRGFELAAESTSEPQQGLDETRLKKQIQVEALKYRYRDIGHLLACMDPLAACPTEHPLLDVSAFGLSNSDLDSTFYTTRFSESGKAPLRDIIKALKETYCHSIGVEYMHLQDPKERLFLQKRMEPLRNQPKLDQATKKRISMKLHQASLWEQFLNKRYLAVTRFSLEGGETIIPMLDVLFDHAAGLGCAEIVLGMAHRGRLNVQAHLLKRPYAEIFAEFENCYDPDSLVGAGDVKYHNGFLTDIKTAAGHNLRAVLVNNPSHLEAVNPVVEGLARARQDLKPGDGTKRIWPVLMHGDGAFAGQGVVAETLNLSQLKGYATGGTIHIIINNQIGYTTIPDDARSTRYSTDIAKMLMVPIFHVHGENPEAAVHVMRLAADYRDRFGKDVVIDLVCFRRYGHNEGDEPYYTQPLMYERIKERPPFNWVYAETLVNENLLSTEQDEQITSEIKNRIEADYQAVHDSACLFPQIPFYASWDGFNGHYDHKPVATGVPKTQLKTLAKTLHDLPKTFSVNSKLSGILDKRLKAVNQGADIDWANAESLAFASLLKEGTPIRLSGQDSGRGTFSQRHCELIDKINGDVFVPLAHIGKDQAPFEIYNSPLSEYAVLGFEYGYSLAGPQPLCLWEAQFGDFANNAQSVIDLFIASGESKWQRLSGLVLLLPHGAEGLGPEHTSARLERFLQLCAGDNWQVCYPTTPNQYFHLLRRQIKLKTRKPLVVMTPKSLLRHPEAVCTLDELTKGHFQAVLGDSAPTKKIQSVLICSGKIFYELIGRRNLIGQKGVAVVRLEQLYPFPAAQLKKMLSKYTKVEKWFWVQEEPANMGAWEFVRNRIAEVIGRPLEYIGRKPAASPASGFPKIYRAQQEAIVSQAVGAKKA